MDSLQNHFDKHMITCIFGKLYGILSYRHRGFGASGVYFAIWTSQDCHDMQSPHCDEISKTDLWRELLGLCMQTRLPCAVQLLFTSSARLGSEQAWRGLGGKAEGGSPPRPSTMYEAAMRVAFTSAAPPGSPLLAALKSMLDGRYGASSLADLMYLRCSVECSTGRADLFRFPFAAPMPDEAFYHWNAVASSPVIPVDAGVTFDSARKF